MDIGDATDCVLQIYNLSPIITTEHLATFLSRFSGEYVLKWLDDANALAIFSNVQQYQAALSSLQTDGTFKIRPYEGPKTSWLRSRTTIKGESASSSTSSSTAVATKDKPAKKTTTDSAKPSPPGLPPPASFAAPNAFAVLLSSPAASSVDDATPDDALNAEAAPSDWEELADQLSSTDAVPLALAAPATAPAPAPAPASASAPVPASAPAPVPAASRDSTPNVWNTLVTSHPTDKEQQQHRPPSPRAVASAAATSAQWPCVHCTFLNPPSASRCGVCENTRF
jgi:hypothetical protein